MPREGGRSAPEAVLMARSYTDVIPEMLTAIGDELAEARSARASTLRVSRGELVHSSSSGFLYHFQSDVPTAALPPESPIRLLIEGREPLDGILVSLEEFRVVVELREDAGATIPEARIEAEPWFILEGLASRIRQLTAVLDGAADPPWRNSGVAAALLGACTLHVDDAEAATPTARRLNREQQRAVERCTTHSVQFVWGPPGTGKTSTLAETVRALAERRERVLVLSHSNVAVDVAISRVADCAGDTGLVGTGGVLRIGRPQLPEVANRPEILPEGVLAKRWPELFARRAELKEALRGITREMRQHASPDARRTLVSRLSSLRSALLEVEHRIRELAEGLIEGARVLGTTLSRLVIDDALWAWKADAVVVDEVSMAAFAQVFAAASRAKKRLLLFGDARQLPPIHLADTPPACKWLGRDAFVVAGVAGNAGSAADDTRVSFLATQYRMGSAIASLVSRLAYNGRLVTPDSVSARARSISSLHPAPGAELVFVDSAPLLPACVREAKRGSYSRLNPVHVALVASLAGALRSGRCRDIAVISPYRAQATLEGRALRSAVEQGVVRASTVHRFQGNESDAVIIDVVDGYPQRGASRLTGNDEDTSLRLINVALSRARGKLLVLMDSRFVLDRHPRNSPLRMAWALRDSASTLELTWPALRNLGGEVEWYENWQQAQAAIRKDVASSTALVCHLPDGFAPSRELVASVSEAERVEPPIVFAPFDIASHFQETRAELRLLPRSSGLVMITAPLAAWVGGTTPLVPVARLAGAEMCRALQEALFSDALAVPSPSAEVEERVSRACGRCPECGEPRRPRLEGSARQWVLRCGNRQHRGDVLNTARLTDIARAAGACCLDCGGPAVVRAGRGPPFLGCENYSSGCAGKPPRLEDLFPSEPEPRWPS